MRVPQAAIIEVIATGNTPAMAPRRTNCATRRSFARVRRPR